MSRPNARREQGFGLLVFVMIITVLAFSLILGYSGVLAKKHANDVRSVQERHVAESAARLEAFYRLHAYELDQDSMASPVSAELLGRAAGITKAHQMELWLSSLLRNPEGLTYRKVALWMPSDTDMEGNSPDFGLFSSTGEFVSCSDASRPCSDRVFTVVSSEAIQRELMAETRARLQKIAYKAQAYFKARLLQDPERNISTNYFRPSGNVCPGLERDIKCFDTYGPLAEVAMDGKPVPSDTAFLLGLTDEELVSAWGMPIELSNLQDSVTDDLPFTMALRTLMPNGQFMQLTVTQPL